MHRAMHRIALLAAVVALVACTAAQRQSVGEFFGWAAPAAAAVTGQPWLAAALGALGRWITEHPGESIPAGAATAAALTHAVHGIPGTGRRRRIRQHRTVTAAVRRHLDQSERQRAAERRRAQDRAHFEAVRGALDRGAQPPA